MKRIFITGANRGLGLEFTRQLLARGERVFAGARRPEQAEALQQLAAAHPDRLTILPLDVTEQASLDAARDAVAERAEALDWLINNAGIIRVGAGSFDRGTDVPLGELQAADLRRVFEINSVAPLLAAQTLLPLLRNSAAPLIANLSSWVGSIADKAMPGYYAYCASKAALNMFTRLLHLDLHSQGFRVVSLHPGWVRTEMGGARAPVATPDAVRGLLQVLDRLTPEQSGRFWDQLGAERNW
ncbi:MAG: SDR family oxidoreductase [Myxococcales bacterium]|nr:SDR family oxidoreductase [Myxococcales bacterium]